MRVISPAALHALRSQFIPGTRVELLQMEDIQAPPVGTKGTVIGVENYADWLYENCGEAILAWVIHGAEKIIAEDFHLVEPDCVTQAIAKYREDNDWLGHFIAERCDVGDEYRERSGDLYAAYRGYCSITGAFTRSTADFYSALEFAGFRKHKERTGSYVDGLKLKDEDSLSVSMDFLGISA